MKLSLERSGLAAYVTQQAAHLFPDGALPSLGEYMEPALDRLEQCFAQIKIKYFFDGRAAVFAHLHTDQYAMFLYFLCNTVYRRDGSRQLAPKLYALNTALPSVDIL